MSNFAVPVSCLVPTPNEISLSLRSVLDITTKNMEKS